MLVPAATAKNIYRALLLILDLFLCTLLFVWTATRALTLYGEYLWYGSVRSSFIHVFVFLLLFAFLASRALPFKTWFARVFVCLVFEILVLVLPGMLCNKLVVPLAIRSADEDSGLDSPDSALQMRLFREHPQLAYMFLQGSASNQVADAIQRSGDKRAIFILELHRLKATSGSNLNHFKNHWFNTSTIDSYYGIEVLDKAVLSSEQCTLRRLSQMSLDTSADFIESVLLSKEQDPVAEIVPLWLRLSLSYAIHEDLAQAAESVHGACSLVKSRDPRLSTDVESLVSMAKLSILIRLAQDSASSDRTNLEVFSVTPSAIKPIVQARILEWLGKLKNRKMITTRSFNDIRALVS